MTGIEWNIRIDGRNHFSHELTRMKKESRNLGFKDASDVRKIFFRLIPRILDPLNPLKKGGIFMLNKKIIYMALAIIIMGLISWSCTKVTRDNPLDPGASNYVKPTIYQTNKIILLADDFESYPPGFPSFPWSAFQNGAIVPSIMAGAGLNLSKGSSFSGTTSDFHNTVMRRTCNITGHFFVEYSMWKDNVFDIFELSFRINDGGGATTYFGLGWGADAANPKVFHWVQGFPNTWQANSIENNTWYRFKIEIDTGTKSVSMWYKKMSDVNYIQVANSIYISALPPTILGFEFFAYAPIGKAWQEHHIDNLELYKLEVVQSK